MPLSSSSPIFIGGLIRWLVDHRRRQELRHENLDEAQLTAESDKSPGVLLASGYIAGGAIAGIFIALTQGVFQSADKFFTRWAESNNPFFAGPYADVLALIPFLGLSMLLYLTGREVFLTGKRTAPGPPRGGGASLSA